jgi:NitT/TauT family transport system permease protein
MITGAIIGLIGGALTAFSPFIRNLFSPVLSVVKSTPIASFIILLFLWLDRDTVACVISALIVLPVVWSNVESGILGTDKSLLEMADAYKMTKLAKLRHIYAPSALPYFTASLRSSLGMSWKAGIAAEALILPTISIGKMIFQSKYNLETVDLFAWTSVTVILSVIIEKAAVLVLKKALKNRNFEAKGGVSFG